MIEKQCMSAPGCNTSFLLDICGICEMWLVFMTSGYQELQKPSFSIWPLFYWKTPDKGFFRRKLDCGLHIRSFTLFSVPSKHLAPNRCSINVFGKYELINSEEVTQGSKSSCGPFVATADKPLHETRGCEDWKSDKDTKRISKNI